MDQVFDEFLIRIEHGSDAAAADGGDPRYTATLLDRLSPQMKEYKTPLRLAQETLDRMDGLCRRILRSDEDAGELSEELGELLGAVLFAGPMRERFVEAFERAVGRNRVLRIRLDVRAVELHRLPWEYLRLRGSGFSIGSSGGQFLAVSPFVSLVRQTDAPAPRPRRGQALRALIVWTEAGTRAAARASGLREVSAAARSLRYLAQVIPEGLAVTYLNGDPTAPAEQKPTRSNIIRTLRSGTWDLVLFVCHGEEAGLWVDPDEPEAPPTSEPSSASSYRAGEAQGLQRADAVKSVIGGSDLAALLGQAGVQVAMFGACSSHAVGAAVAAQVPIVLAMQSKWRGAAASTFWRAFFHAFSERIPIDLCVLEGRQWVGSMADLPDWGIPRLYRGHPAAPPVETEPELNPTVASAQDAPPGPSPETLACAGSRPSLPFSGTTVAPTIAQAGDALAAPVGVEGIGRSSLIASAVWGVQAAASRAEMDLPPHVLEAMKGPVVAAATNWSPGTIALLRDSDPWDVLRMGNQAPTGWTQPIWYTALRRPPPFLAWPRDRRAIRYQATLDDFEVTKPVTLDVSEDNLLWWDDEIPFRIGAGSRVRWEVTGYTSEGRSIRCAGGLFRILSTDELRRLAEIEGRTSSNDDDDEHAGGAKRTMDLARALVLAEAWKGLELYDDAVRLLRLLAGAGRNGHEGYLAHRALASVFKEIFDKLNFHLRWDGPEKSWAGSENERHLRLAYCAVFGRLHQCAAHVAAPCAHCGLGGCDRPSSSAAGPIPS
jgi:hypothetical protein